MTKKIVIEPVTRIEGHGKVTIHLNEQGNVDKTYLHVTQVRGFEKFCEGRLFWEMPVITPRICGICPVSHHLAAAKAGDAILGVKLTPTADKLRRLLHMAQMVQSHALHFFHLASPDLIFGMEADPAKRNVIGVIAAMPDAAVKGVKLRAFGQKIIEAMGDKRVHPNAAVPGGMNRALHSDKRDEILSQIDDIIADCQFAVDLFKDYCNKNNEVAESFADFKSGYLGLVDDNGNAEYYDGKLRLKDQDGMTLEDDVAPEDYLSIIEEKVEDWSYLKFPYYKKMGYPAGMYRVGPLGRLNVADGCTTPLADKEFKEFKKLGKNGILQGSLYYHYARLIEMLNCAEEIKALTGDKDICSTDIWLNSDCLNEEGVGVIEAPRGTLFHHYWVDKTGKMLKANLIVATGHNNLAMNRAVNEVAHAFIKDGKVTEGILNRVEVAIRCYDPCLSCSSHALGHMPLELTIHEADGSIRQVLRS
ncbi:MAG: Ni/Fe hydrogenase subunit alpha [Dehalococcoidales bacterium]|nr:Ni/Fe hydrogenase subunit alpha [Dehalococcoidales bacterium]